MTLDQFIKREEKKMETNQPSQTQPQTKLEWNGKDFREELCNPQTRSFLNANPIVYQWLKSHPKRYMDCATCALKKFFSYVNITPEKFLALEERAAQDLAWEYMDSVRMKRPVKALVAKNYISSFYLYHNEKRLEFIRGKHDIVYEPTREKQHMSKDVCWRMIYKTRNLRDEALLTLAFESGVRRNAIGHMTLRHYNRFLWFNNGEIAIFKVVAQPNQDHTHDNKLRGKGINWYYGCLGKEGTKLLKEYVSKQHQGSNENTLLWKVEDQQFYKIAKACAKRAGYDETKMNFHALRRGFRSVVRSTSTITDSEFKEAIMGHKLRGSQENYFDKDPAEFAREYAKCDFSPSADIITEKDKEIQELKAQLEAIEKAKTEQPKPEPEKTLPNEASTPYPNHAETPTHEIDWTAQYQKDMQQPQEPRTMKCAQGYQFPAKEQCDLCANHNYCDYSTANTHFISHDAT